LYPVNSLENSLVHGGRFTSLIVTRLIFIAALISQYFLRSFLLTRNHRFLYRLSQYSKVPQASHSYNIFITSSYRAFSTGKLSTYYTLCGIVLIFSSRVISLLIWPILKNSYARAFFWLKSIASKICLLFSLMSLTSIYFSLSGFSLAFYANWVYYGSII